MTIHRLIILTACMAAAVAMEARDIRGRILADNDSTAVTGAVCRIFDGTSVAGAASSDADGTFLVTKAPDRQLRLEVSLAGYSPTEILIAAGRKDVDAGDVFLVPSNALGEVTVTAQSMNDSRGRTIVFPSASEVKASQTSILLFQKLALPGLEANPITRSLSVDGGSPVILVNGVPSTMEEVQSIAPADIARVEYSRVTPARYADRDARGLINITLRKRTDGGDVFLWGRTAFTTAFVDGNMRASYHQGPSQFTLSYNPSWRNYKKVYDRSTESFIAPDFRTDIVSSDCDPFNYFHNGIYAKYNYTPSSRTLFSATFNITTLTNKQIFYGSSLDTALGGYDFTRSHRGKNVHPSLDLFLRHDFNDRNSLEVQLVGTLGDDKSDSDNRYAFESDSTSRYATDIDSRRRSLISEIAYVHTFSTKTSLSAGYQNTVSHNRNKYIGSDYRPILTENNNYIYASLSQQAGSVNINISTGAKMFWVKNDLNRRHFIRNLTSATVNWRINDAWSLMARFRYSPIIPSLSALTDYPQQSTPYLVSNGNPHLKVAENFQYAIQPSVKIKKFSASLYLSYFNNLNSVFADIRYLGDHRFLQQSVNSRRYRDYYATLNMSISDIHGFGAQAELAADRYETAGDGWSHHLNTIYGSVTVWYNINKWTFAYWHKFPGKSLWGHSVSKAENGNAFQVDYNLNKHWNFQASCLYLFVKRGSQYPSWNYSSINPKSSERWIKDNANMVTLSVRYSADFGSIFRSGRRSLNNSDSGSSIFSY